MARNPESRDDIDLLDLFQRIVRSWRLVAAVALAATALSVGIALVLPPTYEAEVVMLPAKADDTSRLSGLAGMASQLGLGSLGVGLGGQSDRKAEAVATLKSRILVDAYINEKNLLPVLFERKWDAARGQWKVSDPEKQPTVWDGYKVFDKKIRTVEEDSKSGLVTLTIAWKDKKLAAQWAIDLVARTNAYLRQKALDQSSRNLAYLNDELKKTTVLELQQALYVLIESEIKQTMMARGNDEYAFRVIDPAVVPKEKTRPNRVLIVLLGIMGGVLVGSGWAILRSGSRRANGFG